MKEYFFKRFVGGTGCYNWLLEGPPISDSPSEVVERARAAFHRADTAMLELFSASCLGRVSDLVPANASMDMG